MSLSQTSRVLVETLLGLEEGVAEVTKCRLGSFQAIQATMDLE